MQRILVIGAGRSANTLIDFLLERAAASDWYIVVADQNEEQARAAVGGCACAQGVAFDINLSESREMIVDFDMVISMLPARFHIEAAKICASRGINMLTASYLSSEIKALSEEFTANGAGLVMEMGLDPGIDHMSAMSLLDSIRNDGHQLLAFETFAGGLLAPSKADNPWEYKFTWNPRNVVLAGQGNVKFIQEGRYKYIPYQRLFKRTEIIYIPEHGYFEGYANRNSLKYLDAYRLRGIHTLYRGTLRRPGFCRAWDVFVQLGATDDGYLMEGAADMTHRQFINSFLSYNPHDSVELKLAHYMNLDLDAEIMYKLKWLGIFDDELIGLREGTPAQLLEHILKKKWTMNGEERDMIVMWHKVIYRAEDELKEIQSHMVLEGSNAAHTAMSTTVGLPLAVTAKLMLQGKLKVRGVWIPTEKHIYEPVLAELEKYGVAFAKRESVLPV